MFLAQPVYDSLAASLVFYLQLPMLLKHDYKCSYNISPLFSGNVMENEAMKNEDSNIVYVESGLLTHSFSEKIGAKTLLFSVLKLKDSVFVWIGLATEPKLMNICLAMKSPYDTLPLTTNFLGSVNDDKSSALASKLSIRLKKPVFVSVNVELDRFQFPELSARLNEEIKLRPECF